MEMIGILFLSIALHPDVTAAVDNDTATVTAITVKQRSECSERPTRECQRHVRIITTIGWNRVVVSLMLPEECLRYLDLDSGDLVLKLVAFVLVKRRSAHPSEKIL